MQFCNVTGPEAGLKLILNVEKYENIPGLAYDIGVKVSKTMTGNCIDYASFLNVYI